MYTYIYIYIYICQLARFPYKTAHSRCSHLCCSNSGGAYSVSKFLCLNPTTFRASTRQVRAKAGRGRQRQAAAAQPPAHARSGRGVGSRGARVGKPRGLTRADSFVRGELSLTEGKSPNLLTRDSSLCGFLLRELSKTPVQPCRHATIQTYNKTYVYIYIYIYICIQVYTHRHLSPGPRHSPLSSYRSLRI